MRKKKLFLLAICLMGLVAVSAVSAAENATDDIEQASDGTQDLEIVEDEVLHEEYIDTSFYALQDLIDNSGPNSTLTLDKDYQYYYQGWGKQDWSNIEIDKDLTIDGNGHTVDGNGQRNVFTVTSGNVTLKNIRIINGIEGYMYGGGVYVQNGVCTAIGCTFENNGAVKGGAMYGGTAINCTFTSNYADARGTEGGAMCGGTAINCVFIKNRVIHSQDGGYGGALSQSTAINCVFINNTADEAGDAMSLGTADSCIFINNGWDNTLILRPSFSVSNFASAYGSGDRLMINLMTNTTNERILNRNVNVTIYDRNGARLSNFSCLSEGWVVDLPVGSYIAECVPTDYEGFSPVNATLSVSMADSNITIIPHDIRVNLEADALFSIVLPLKATGNLTVDFNGNVSKWDVVSKGYEDNGNLVIYVWNKGYPVGQYNLTATYSGDANIRGSSANATCRIVPIKVNLTADAPQAMDVASTANISYAVTPNELIGNVTFTSSNPKVVLVDSNGTITAVGGGTAVITVSCNVNENYTSPEVQLKITVNRFATKIMANAVSATCNVNKNLVITLTDAKGNPLSGLVLTVKLNGAKDYTTDKNGQVKINVAKLSGKTYNAKITFAGNSIYSGYAKSVKVTVKKAAPKLIAKKKTYRAGAKTKKFTVTLKSNTGKPIKNAKVWISIKKITKKAKAIKTNSKGKATFKFNKNKKGKYLVTIKFKGDKYYRSITKKVKITIR